MSYFKAKMHQIRLRCGSAPDLAGEADSAPPDPLAGFKGPTSKGKAGKEKGGEGKGLKGGEVGKGGDGKEKGRERARGRHSLA